MLFLAQQSETILEVSQEVYPDVHGRWDLGMSQECFGVELVQRVLLVTR